MDTELAVGLLQHINAQTKEKAGDEYCLLMVDGHTSHCTLPFLTYAKDAQIVVGSYPPHSTHKLQGLDRLPFGVMKRLWAAEQARREREGLEKISKSNFIEVLSQIWEPTFSEANIKTAWRITGLIPFDRTVVSERDMAPSVETSTTEPPPSQLSTPYRAILTAARPRLLTGTSQSVPTSPANPFISRNTEPDSPTLVRTRLRENLEGTSASFLAFENEPFDSTAVIPALQFEEVPSLQSREDDDNAAIDQLLEENERLRVQLEAVSEKTDRVQAQLVLYSLYALRLKEALHTKEMSAKKGRGHLLAKGFARHLTSEEFMQALEDDHQQKLAEAAAAEARRDLKGQRKVLAAWRKARTVMMADKRKEAKAAYIADCERAEEMGERKPKKPKAFKRPETPEHLKIVLPTVLAEDEDEDDESEGEYDE